MGGWSTPVGLDWDKTIGTTEWFTHAHKGIFMGGKSKVTLLGTVANAQISTGKGSCKCGFDGKWFHSLSLLVEFKNFHVYDMADKIEFWLSANRTVLSDMEKGIDDKVAQVMQSEAYAHANEARLSEESTLLRASDSMVSDIVQIFKQREEALNHEEQVVQKKRSASVVKNEVQLEEEESALHEEEHLIKRKASGIVKKSALYGELGDLKVV